MSQVAVNRKRIFLKYDDTELDPKTLKEVQREINETTETREKGLRCLKKMLSNVNGLHAYLDDGFLLSYLRASKFDTKKAYARLLLYYQCKKQYSDILVFALPSLTLNTQQCNTIQILPYRAPDNSLLILRTCEFWDPSSMPFLELILILKMVTDLMTKNPITQMCGVTIILDFTNIGFKMLKECKPGILKFCAALSKGCPLRYKAMHVVNASTIYHLVRAVWSPFMSKKLQSRLILHPNDDDWKSLHSYLPPEILPKKYGGCIENTVDTMKMINDEEDYFRNEMQYGYVDELKQ